MMHVVHIGYAAIISLYISVQRWEILYVKVYCIWICLSCETNQRNMDFNKRIYFLTNIIIWINKCLTMKTHLRREILEQLTALPQPLVMSRKEVTVCWRVSPARLPNTQQPSLENMDLPRPQLLETTSSPRRNMKILPLLQLLPTFPMLSRKN